VNVDKYLLLIYGSSEMKSCLAGFDAFFRRNQWVPMGLTPEL